MKFSMAPALGVEMRGTYVTCVVLSGSFSHVALTFVSKLLQQHAALGSLNPANSQSQTSFAGAPSNQLVGHIDTGGLLQAQEGPRACLSRVALFPDLGVFLLGFTF